MQDLCVIILTHNEQMHIERVLCNVLPIARQVFIIDSFSQDSTLDIASKLGARVFQRCFLNHAEQFQWALDNLPIETEWVMRLDADETLTSELIDEISRKLSLLSPDVTGVNLKRRHIFLGRWIKHGGRYPLTLLRIWRKNAAKIEQRWMDEHLMLLRGRAVTFDYDFSDHNLNDVTFFTDKHNKYATREAIDRLNKEFDLFVLDEGVSQGASSGQARLKRVVKERVYNRLPFGFGPLGYFLWRYVAQVGFLDGREGLIYHFLQGFWYRFLVEAKVLELRRSVSHLRDRDAVREELCRITHLSIK